MKNPRLRKCSRGFFTENSSLVCHPTEDFKAVSVHLI